MNILEWLGGILKWLSGETSAFTLLGVLLGWGLSHCSAKNLADDLAKREAGRRCRRVFSRAQEIMHSAEKKSEKLASPALEDESEIRQRMLNEEISRQHRAVIEFSYYLSDSEKIRMFDAWKNYSSCNQSLHGNKSVWLTPYFHDGASKPWGLPALELFDNRINAILIFTIDKRDKTIRGLWRHFYKKFSRSA